MSKRETIEAKCEELVTPIATANGVYVYDVEYVKEGSDYYLRVFIDKEDGVNIIECEAVSRAFSDVLDKVDPIPEAYILEVSSPGLGRTLKKDRHFARSIGDEVELKLFKAIEGVKEFEGILKGYDEKTVTLEIGEEGQEAVFNRDEIAVIRLALDF